VPIAIGDNYKLILLEDTNMSTYSTYQSYVRQPYTKLFNWLPIIGQYVY